MACLDPACHTFLGVYLTDLQHINLKNRRTSRVQVGFRVEGLGLKALGLGLRVQGLGFRV